MKLKTLQIINTYLIVILILLGIWVCLERLKNEDLTDLKDTLNSQLDEYKATSTNCYHDTIVHMPPPKDVYRCTELTFGDWKTGETYDVNKGKVTREFRYLQPQWGNCSLLPYKYNEDYSIYNETKDS